MSKHTPGPWSCHPTSNHAHDYRLSRPNGPMPYAAPYNDHSEARANARLIAAAPDLLAALEAARAALCHLVIGRPDDAKAVDYEAKIQAINAAIAKATGA